MTMSHNLGIIDDDYRFIVDPETRRITNEESGSISLMQYDHNCERFTFEIPRYIEGHDLYECTSVQVHYTNTASGSMRRSNFGVYPILDLEIGKDDEETLICTWLISQNATQLVGVLDFTLRFTCVKDGTIQYIWSTFPYEGVNINKTIYHGDDVMYTYPETLEELERNVRDSLIASIEQTGHGAGSNAPNEITVTYGNGTKQIFHVYNGGQGTCVCDDEGVLTIDGRRLRIFVGTKAEHDALSDEQKQNLFAIVTDDVTSTDILDLIETSDGKMLSLENLLVSLMVRVTALETSLTESGNKITSLETSLTESGNKITSLENTVDNLSTTMSSINSSISGLSSQIAQLNAQVNNLTSRVTALESNTGGGVPDGGGEIETPTSTVTIRNDSRAQLTITYVDKNGTSQTTTLSAATNETYTSKPVTVRSNSTLYVSSNKMLSVGTNSYGYSVTADGEYCFTIYGNGSINIDDKVKSVKIENVSVVPLKIIYTNVNDATATEYIASSNNEITRSTTVDAVTGSYVYIMVNDGSAESLTPSMIAIDSTSYSYSNTSSGRYRFTINKDGTIVVEDKAGTSAPATIEFVVQTVSYTVTNGMTWFEWAKSAGNTRGYVCTSNDSPVRQSSTVGSGLVKYNGAVVYGRDRIVANGVYKHADTTPNMYVDYSQGVARVSWDTVASGVTYTVYVGQKSYVTANTSYDIKSNMCNVGDRCRIEVYAGGEHVGSSEPALGVKLNKLDAKPYLEYLDRDDQSRAYVSTNSTNSAIVCHWTLFEEGTAIDSGTAGNSWTTLGPTNGPGSVSAFNRCEGYIDSDTVALDLIG